MSEEEFIAAGLQEIRGLMKRFPAGSYVWHRANGARMVVDGWKLAGDGKGLVSANSGNGYNTFYDFELSGERITADDGDGSEHWKA